MTPTDEIREAMTRYRSYRSGGNPAEIWDRPESDRYRDLSIIADAVLNPPPDVAEAMRRSRDGFAHCAWPENWPDCNHARKVTDWIVSLTAPNTEAK